MSNSVGVRVTISFGRSRSQEGRIRRSLYKYIHSAIECSTASLPSVYHQLSLNSVASITPTCTPCTNPDRSCSLQRVQTG